MLLASAAAVPFPSSVLPGHGVGIGASRESGAATDAQWRPSLSIVYGAGESERRRRHAGLSVCGDDAVQRERHSQLVSSAMSEAYAPSTTAKDLGHWRAWEAACQILGTSPWRTDIAANLGIDAEGHQEELFLLSSALLLMYMSMRPRRRSDPAADPRSALKKLQAVRRIHRARMLTMAPLSSALMVTKGLMRRYIREHGVATLIPDRKLPLTNVLIDAMLAAPAANAGATRGTLPPLAATSYFWIAAIALFAVCAETGARKAEVSGAHGKNGFTFRSLTYKIGGKLYPYFPGAELIATMSDGDGVLLAHSVAKNDPYGAFFAATPSFLIDAMLAAPAANAGATRGTLPPLAATSYFWIAAIALFAVCAETGARKAEVSGAHGKNGFTFRSLTYKIGGKLYPYFPGAELIATMSDGDGVLLAHSVAKNDPYGAFFAATPSFLPWRVAGRCACRLLIALEQAAGVPAALRASTPLFGPSMGAYFTGHQLDEALILLLTAGAGLTIAECENYSVHSFRIFAACALLQAGAPNWLIKRMLRWRGDESLEIYARVSDSEWGRWLEAARHATVDATVVPRLPNMDFSEEQQRVFTEMAHSLLGIGAGRAASADGDASQDA